MAYICLWLIYVYGLYMFMAYICLWLIYGYSLYLLKIIFFSYKEVGYKTLSN
jgi:hypothetical protein